MTGSGRASALPPAAAPSDDIRVGFLLTARKPHPLRTRADVLERDLVEARLDTLGEVAEHCFRDVHGVSFAKSRVAAFAEHERSFERANDIPQANLGGFTGQTVPPLRTSLRRDDASTLQILENLLQKPRRDALSLRDVFGLRRLPLIEVSDIKQSPDRIAPLVGESHGGSYMRFRIDFVKNAQQATWPQRTRPDKAVKSPSDSADWRGL